MKAPLSAVTSSPSRIDGKFTDRVALVTGGARGIGRAIAEGLQRRGAHVVLLDCDAHAAETAAREMCRDGETPVHFLQADIGSGDALRAVSGSIVRIHGRLDLLFNNAGVEIEKP